LKRLVIMFCFLIASGLNAPVNGAPETATPIENVEESASEILKRFTKRTAKLILAGDIYYETGKLEQADKCWQEALALDESDDLLARFAKLHRRRGDYAKLIALEKKRLLRSSTPHRHSALAEALQLAGDTEGAERIWRNIAAEGRWSEASTGQIALSCITANRADFAVQLLKSTPVEGGPSALFHLAQAQAAMGRFKEAASTMERYLNKKTSQPRATSAIKRWAWFVVAARREQQEARKLDRKIVRAEKELISAYLAELGRTSSGRLKKQITGKLQSLAPDNPRVRSLSAKNKSKAGDE